MEMIITIFSSLGVDKTVFIQFVSLIIIFALVSNLLFTRVKIVLDTREEKTTKLEGNAHAIYKKAEELSEHYKATIEKTHQESHKIAQNKKNEILNIEKSFLKETEDKLNAEYESKKAEMVKEFRVKKEKVLSEVDGLSNQLIEKITK